MDYDCRNQTTSPYRAPGAGSSMYPRVGAAAPPPAGRGPPYHQPAPPASWGSLDAPIKVLYLDVMGSDPGSSFLQKGMAVETYASQHHGPLAGELAGSADLARTGAGSSGSRAGGVGSYAAGTSDVGATPRGVRGVRRGPSALDSAWRRARRGQKGFRRTNGRGGGILPPPRGAVPPGGYSANAPWGTADGLALWVSFQDLELPVTSHERFLCFPAWCDAMPTIPPLFLRQTAPGKPLCLHLLIFLPHLRPRTGTRHCT
ncbi:hypothetical protein KSP40_PGU020415 [Platanthera guangdongensis]|uniref:Uncharacterized protein n=1 Tax=Platanthera guangdongensis TaxID=2320717 RepID=A0ABR2N0W8_9ASPA